MDGAKQLAGSSPCAPTIENKGLWNISHYPFKSKMAGVALRVTSSSIAASLLLATLAPCRADPAPAIHYAPIENLEHIDVGKRSRAPPIAALRSASISTAHSLPSAKPRTAMQSSPSGPIGARGTSAAMNCRAS
jgi:hypothetical protein